MNKVNNYIADIAIGGAPAIMEGAPDTKALITGMVVLVVKEIAVKLIDKLFKKRSNEKAQ